MKRLFRVWLKHRGLDNLISAVYFLNGNVFAVIPPETTFDDDYIVYIECYETDIDNLKQKQIINNSKIVM